MPDAAPEMMATLAASLIAVLPFALNAAQASKATVWDFLETVNAQ
jgi:hypothetical protein